MAATVGDETRRTVAKVRNARAAFIAILAGYVKVFGVGGDVEAARIATDAISRLLGSHVRLARVVDIQRAKPSLRDQ